MTTVPENPWTNPPDVANTGVPLTDLIDAIGELGAARCVVAASYQSTLPVPITIQARERGWRLAVYWRSRIRELIPLALGNVADSAGLIDAVNRYSALEPAADDRQAAQSVLLHLEAIEAKDTPQIAAARARMRRTGDRVAWGIVDRITGRSDSWASGGDLTYHYPEFRAEVQGLKPPLDPAVWVSSDDLNDLCGLNPDMVAAAARRKGWSTELVNGRRWYRRADARAQWPAETSDL